METHGALFLIQGSVILQLLFTAVAGFDALYFHFHKVRIHARPETRAEHTLHTLNACLFPVTVYFLYAGNFGGLCLWAAIAATLATFVVELLDVAHEKASRRLVGGLTPAESVLHFAMGILRGAAFAFALAAKPLAAFFPSSALVLAEPYPDWVLVVGRAVFGASLPMAALHVAYALAPLRRGSIGRGSLTRGAGRTS